MTSSCQLMCLTEVLVLANYLHLMGTGSALIKRNIRLVRKQLDGCPVCFCGNLKCKETHEKPGKRTFSHVERLSVPKRKYSSGGPHRVSQFLLAYLPKIKWSVKQSGPASTSTSISTSTSPSSCFALLGDLHTRRMRNLYAIKATGAKTNYINCLGIRLYIVQTYISYIGCTYKYNSCTGSTH